MERCMDCNSLLTKTEKVCGVCGTKAPRPNAKPGGMGFVTLLDFAFVASILLIAAIVIQPSSLTFLPVELSIEKCIIATIVLLILRVSASQAATR